MQFFDDLKHNVGRLTSMLANDATLIQGVCMNLSYNKISLFPRSFWGWVGGGVIISNIERDFLMHIR